MEAHRPPRAREIDGRIVVVVFAVIVVLTVVVLWVRRHESGHDVHLGSSRTVTALVI